MDIDPGKKWECPTCSKTIKEKGNFTKHLATHDPDAKVKCQVSVYICNTETDLAISSHHITHILLRFVEKFIKIHLAYALTCGGFILMTRNDPVVTRVIGSFSTRSTYGNILKPSTARRKDVVSHARSLVVGKPT